MLNITSFRSARQETPRRPHVAILAGWNRRIMVKKLIGQRAAIVAELESSARIHLLESVRPEIVIVDAASDSVNFLSACRWLVKSDLAARIVILSSDSDLDSILHLAGFSPEMLTVVHPAEIATLFDSAYEERSHSSMSPSPAAA